MTDSLKTVSDFFENDKIIFENSVFQISIGGEMKKIERKEQI